MKVVPSFTPAKAPDISLLNLDKVQLDATNGARLDALRLANGGDPAWQMRKLREAHELLALGQIAWNRMTVVKLELFRELRAILALNCPIPCRPDGNNRLRLARGALLGMRYGDEAVRRPQPGSAFFQIFEPHHVFHASVHQPEQTLCLGASLPAGIRVRELVLLAYAALSMQTVQVNEFAPTGVMNLEAATWWQQNLERVPLTREPFLVNITPTPAEDALC